MKKIILSVIIVLTIFSNLSATNPDSVILSLRKKAYERYHQVKDTVTVRTWMNMDRMNKALMQVVEFDNQLLKSYKNRDTAQAAIIPQNTDTVAKTQVMAKTPVAPQPWIDLKYLVFTSILIGALVLILLVLVIKRTLSLNRLRKEYNERDDTFDAKLKRLEILESDVLKMKARENEIKSELEKGIVHYQEKMQTMRKRIDELAIENTRLENLSIELTKNREPERIISNEKSPELKQEIIVESEGLIQRVKKVRKPTGLNQ